MQHNLPQNIFVIRNFTPIVLFLIVMNLFSCADLSIDSNNNPDSSNKKINVLSPLDEGSMQEGQNNIIYSLSQPYSIKFIELYINDIFVKNIPPNSDGSAPQISVKLDSSDIGKTISLYLIYYDKDGTSSKSNVIKNINVTGDTRIPFKPYNLSLINFNNGSCNISWKDSSRFVEKYELWRKVDLPGEYLLLQQLSGNAFNTNDYNLDTNKIYFYKIRGVKSSGNSEFSNEINTEGLLISGDLYPATNLTANILSNSVIQLKWNDNSINENYFSVERSTNNISYSRIGTVPANTISYTDSGSGLILGSTYFYRIKSYSNTDSAISNIIQVKLTSGILIAPSNLTGTYKDSIGVVELSWINNDNNAVYVDIEKKTETGGFSLLRRVSAGTNLFLDFNITTNQIYTYRIRGYDLNTFSEYSNELTISTY